MQQWLLDYWWITYLFIFFSLAFVYNKVFRMQKRLPLLKEVLLYLILAFGALILLFFQLDIGLPIVYSLAIALSLLLIVKLRYWLTENSQNK